MRYTKIFIRRVYHGNESIGTGTILVQRINDDKNANR